MSSVAERFKVGEKVKLTGKSEPSRAYAQIFSVGELLTVGGEKDDDGDYGCYSERIRDWWHVPACDLAPADPPTPKLKVGDRVVAHSKNGRWTCGPGTYMEDGAKGEVVAVGGTITVRLDNAPLEKYHYSPDELTPESPAALTYDGKEYNVTPNADGTITLTPVREEAERDPQVGEVWRVEGGRLYWVTSNEDVDGQRLAIWLTGPETGSIGALEDTDDDEEPETFAYPSLAAAIADNALN